jgi:chromosome segregation ATPase
MAKKQFIRHLEFYGFPDQNGYSSEINGVDLSDIREKNKEQDEEIQDLEGEKADKKDLVALSGTLESFITRQSEINQEFADAISGMSGDIEELKTIDTEFAEQLSAVTSGVDEAMDAIEILGDRIEDVEDSVSGISGIIESITEEYAKKEDVYSKEEIDDMIASGFSGYATQEWVEEQGYITEEEADAKYARIDDLEALSGAVESAATDIDDRLEEINDAIDDVNDKVDDLAEDLSAFSEDVASAFSEVNETIDQINEEISGITEDIADLVEVVSGNTAAIDELNEAVSANTEAIEDLDNKIDDAVSALTEDIQEVKDELDDKANVSDLEDLHTEMINGLENLENKKAEKEDLNFVSGAVDAVDAKIDAEIARSTSADAVMQNKIDELDAEVQEAVETVESYGDRIDQIESGLAQEIIDRQNGDTALIGTSGDSDSADTIWGAKNLADMYKGQAIASAKTYTDDKFAEFDGELQNLEDRIEQQMSQFATEEFVISACNDTEAEIRGELGTAINNEVERAERAETNMEVEIQSLSAQVLTNIGHISNNASRLNAITRWQGSDPEEYDDSGNGILDVLHREFHEYERTHWAIKNIEFVDGNLIITYDTPEGEKQEVIPIKVY